MSNNGSVALTEKQEPGVPQSPRGRRFGAFFAGLAASLLAGLVASLVSVACMGVLRLFAGIPTPVELFGDFVLKENAVFSALLLVERKRL